MPGRQADQLLLAKRLRYGLRERRASVRRIGSLDRRDQGAIGGRAQERARVRIEGSIIEPRQPGTAGIGTGQRTLFGHRRRRRDPGGHVARDVEGGGGIGRRIGRRRGRDKERRRCLGCRRSRWLRHDGDRWLHGCRCGDDWRRRRRHVRRWRDLRRAVFARPPSTAFVGDRRGRGLWVDVGPTTTGARSGRCHLVVGHASPSWLDSNRAESSTFRALSCRSGRC
jgi:hypothetical protein